MKMSKEVKVALIGGAATVVAAIISGIFLLRSAVLNSPNPSPTSATSASTAVAPQTTPTASSAGPVKIQLTCTSDNCLSTITVVLDSIGVSESRYLTLNFQVKNTSPDACLMYFSPLLLQDENSNQAPYQPAGPGTGSNGEQVQSNQSATISPYFPQAPHKGRFDLQVGLRVTCPPGGNNTVSMSYQNVLGIGG
jgi:hypothetical protein